MAKRKSKRKDKTIPTLDDVVLKKPQEEDTAEAAAAEQKDSTKTEDQQSEKRAHNRSNWKEVPSRPANTPSRGRSSGSDGRS